MSRQRRAAQQCSGPQTVPNFSFSSHQSAATGVKSDPSSTLGGREAAPWLARGLFGGAEGAVGARTGIGTQSAAIPLQTLRSAAVTYLLPSRL